MCAPVDGAVLAKDIVGADLQGGGLPDVFQILSFTADEGEGKKLVGFPKGGGALQNDVGVKHAVITKSHVCTDDAVGADTDVPTELSLRGNDGGGVDHRPSLGWPGAG